MPLVSYSLRTVLVGDDEKLSLLPNISLDKIWEEPEKHPVRKFAGKQIRAASIAVLLRNRRPVKVVQSWYILLDFDFDGVFDPKIHVRRAAILIDDQVSKPDDGGDSRVHDATGRFVVRGGKWEPSIRLKQAIYEVALGKRRVPRLRLDDAPG